MPFLSSQPRFAHSAARKVQSHTEPVVQFFGQTFMAILPSRRARIHPSAFTVLELLVVIGLLFVLCFCLLHGLSSAKDQAQSARCRNQLRQVGISLAIYLTDSCRYPPMWDADSGELWADKLYTPIRAAWTNQSWNCPKFISRGGAVGFTDEDNISVSYAYNWRGTATGWSGRARGALPPSLGLGHLSKDEIIEPEVAAPAEMFAASDVRATVERSRLFGNPKMSLYRFAGVAEAPPLHESDYNILFADGHVETIKRGVFLFPPTAAHSWNKDNLPHPETWAPENQWAVRH